MRIILTFLPFYFLSFLPIIIVLFFLFYSFTLLPFYSFTFLLFYFFTFLLFTLLPFPYLVSKSYIQIKVERFFFVDGVERRVVVEEIAQARLCIDANVVGNLKL